MGARVATPSPSEAPGAQPINAGLARAVNLIAALLALVVAIAPPVGYFAVRHAAEAMVATQEAEQLARGVSALVATHPDGWAFQLLALQDRLAPLALDSLTPERRVLASLSGVELAARLVPEGVTAVPGPTLTRSADVLDFGWPVATVTVTRSVHEATLTTAMVALFAAIGGALVFITMRTLPLGLLRRAMDRAAWLATHDALTGLPNRTLFRERLSAALALGQRDGGIVAVLCLDLDQFKEVNDTLGHGAGDRLLREVSARLSACVRTTDTLARLGGDEFAIVQVQAGQPRDAERLAARLLEVIAAPFDLDGHQVIIGTSIGIALADGAADPSRLLQEADLALYQAKEGGRSAFRFFEAAMNERLVARKTMEADLRRALAEGGFRLAYQPLVALGEDGTQRVVGAEALLRWPHPTLGNIPPDRFIALAEETGLIVPIGQWALNEACREAAAWPVCLSIAVNVSPVQFGHAGFFASVERALQENGLDPARLELEVTEGVLMTDTEETVAQLERLRRLGVRLALDDFGTGYSSLGYLRKFRFDKIKIDRSFTSHLGTNGESEAIVRAVVGISHALGVRANAEGVETAAHAAMLRAEGCHEVQGYFFGRPVPGDAFAASHIAGLMPEAAIDPSGAGVSRAAA
jgi:diguanylate cyclase (GGDEF)-like protein